MSKFEFNNICVGIDKPNKKEKGVVVVGKKSIKKNGAFQQVCVHIQFQRQDNELAKFFDRLQKYIVKIQKENEQLHIYKEKVKILEQHLINECKEHRDFCTLANAKIKELEQKNKHNIAIDDSIYGMPYTAYLDLLELGYKVVESGVMNGRYIRVLEKD